MRRSAPALALLLAALGVGSSLIYAPAIFASTDLALEDRTRVGVAFFLMSEENVRKQIGLPWVSFGSDIPLEEAVRRLSGLPATTTGALPGRALKGPGARPAAH